MEVWVTTDPNIDRIDNGKGLVLCVVARGRGEETWSVLDANSEQRQYGQGRAEIS